jgi:pilus assembly protein CpaF
MRPDRIIVGEVRGAEALDMLQSMNTGHAGSMSTIHANSSIDAISRLETLTLLSGAELPLRAVRDQIASAMDLVIHLSRMPNGERRVVSVNEVLGVADGEIRLAEIYSYNYSSPRAGNKQRAGNLAATGHVPTFLKRLSDYGVDFPTELFAKG